MTAEGTQLGAAFTAAEHEDAVMSLCVRLKQSVGGGLRARLERPDKDTWVDVGP